MTILVAKKLIKSFDKTQILSGIDLVVKKQETVAISGKSGSGKTTLLHILGTLEKADDGQLKAVDLSRIGFVFQSYNLLEDFTVIENVLMPARIARKKTTREMGLALLEKVGLQDKADLPAKLLSGGEKQRVAIARALCNDPDLILADEPTGNLDRDNSRKIIELLLSLNKALILVTHDPEMAALCQTRYLLQDGVLNMMSRMEN